MIRIATDLRTPVSLINLTPQMSLGAVIVAGVFNDFGYLCLVTSGSDGKHSLNSLHYSGRAMDFRTRDINPRDLRDFAAKVREALGSEWNVVVEDTHLHVEWDPDELKKKREPRLRVV